MKKGISQVLTIIVTALVLLTAALAVIALVLDSTQDTGSGLREGQCVADIRASCSGLTDQVAFPNSCYVGNDPDNELRANIGTDIEGIENVESTSGETATCVE
jgi:hypothetical protein